MDKVVELVGGGSVINGPTPSSFEKEWPKFWCSVAVPWSTQYWTIQYRTLYYTVINTVLNHTIPNPWLHSNEHCTTQYWSQYLNFVLHSSEPFTTMNWTLYSTALNPVLHSTEPCSTQHWTLPRSVGMFKLLSPAQFKSLLASPSLNVRYEEQVSPVQCSVGHCSIL